MPGWFDMTFCFALLPAYPGGLIAYIDPHSGSLLLQLILAGAAGLGVGLKYFGARILSLFRRPARSAGSVSNGETDATEATPSESG